MPSYLAGNRELLEKYDRWRAQLPASPGGCDKSIRGRARSGSQTPVVAPADDGSAVRRARKASQPPPPRPPPLPLPMSALVPMSPPVEETRRRCHEQEQQQQQQQQQHATAANFSAASTAAAVAVATSVVATVAAADSGATTAVAIAAADADNAAVPIAAGSVGVGALTPPLIALRTRSHRRRGGSSGRGDDTALLYTLAPGSEPTTRRRGDAEAEPEADTEADTEPDTPFARFSRMTVSSSPLPLPPPPLLPSEELPPVRVSTERGGTPSEAREGQTEEDDEEEKRDNGTDTRKRQRQERGLEQRKGQGQPPRGEKQVGRTKRLVIGVGADNDATGAAGGVARRVGAGRRAVALGKRWVGPSEGAVLFRLRNVGVFCYIVPVPETGRCRRSR